MYIYISNIYIAPVSVYIYIYVHCQKYTSSLFVENFQT